MASSDTLYLTWLRLLAAVNFRRNLALRSAPGNARMLGQEFRQHQSIRGCLNAAQQIIGE
jgi:hypothetical protein